MTTRGRWFGIAWYVATHSIDLGLDVAAEIFTLDVADGDGLGSLDLCGLFDSFGRRALVALGATDGTILGAVAGCRVPVVGVRLRRCTAKVFR